MNELSWQSVILELLYRQHRTNKSHHANGEVDVLATQKRADQLHDFLEAQCAANRREGKATREESFFPLFGLHCRTYRAGTLPFPICDVHVCIPTLDSPDESIFAILDHASLTYFCLISGERKEFPAFPKP